MPYQLLSFISPEFWRKRSPGAQCASIYQSRPHPSAAVRYNRHSWYQKSLQDSHFTELTLRLCHPPLLYPVRRRASADLHLAIWRWEKKEELALPSSESRTEMEFFFFLILFPFPSYHIQLSNTILCKAFSGTGMCTWWINQQTLKNTAATVSCYMQVWLSARCGRLHFSPSSLVFCTPECRGSGGREKQT